jgi:hypothetical protein
MKSLACFVLTLGLSAVLAAPSFAQRQPGQGRGQFGAGQGGVGALLAMEPVQKELKMEKEQVDKTTEAVKKVRDKHADEYTKLADLAAEERTKKRTELTKMVNEETLASVGEVLKPEQMKRLKQLELQRAGTNAFTREEVAKGLVFTTEQTEKVKTITDESNTKMRELMGGGRGAGGAGGARPARGQGGANPNAEKIAALRKETLEKVTAVMTDEQKGKWKEMTGETFEFPAPTRRPVPKKDN